MALTEAEIDTSVDFDTSGFAGAYADDVYFAPVVRVFAAEQEMARHELVKQFGSKTVNRRDLFKMDDGLLYWQVSDKPRRLCIPARYVKKLLHNVHDSAGSGGHFGLQKTYQSLVDRVFFPRMYTAVRRYVKSCATCLRVKPTRQMFGLLQPLPLESRRWSRIGIDFVVKLPTTADTNFDTIVTIVDHSTKRVHWFPTNEAIDAATFAWLFFDNYVRHHGLLAKIVSDRDARFMSDFWRSLMAMMKVEMAPSSPFHPQTDGASEKANSVVMTFLRAFVTSKPRWDKLLPLAEFVYNSSHHDSIGMSPFELDLGWKPRSPLDMIVNQGGVGQGDGTVGRAVGDEFSSHLKHVMEKATRVMEDSQVKQKLYADKQRKKHSFAAGQMVFLSTSHLPATYSNVFGNLSNKLQHRWAGPFRISRMFGNAAELELSADLGIHPVQNVQYLRPDTSEPHLNKPVPPPLRVDNTGAKVQEVESNSSTISTAIPSRPTLTAHKQRRVNL